MTPRPDVSEIRKTQILEAAAKVFLTRGIGSTRMDDIVAESGLSKGTLYWYFNSKDDIIIGLVQQLIDSELDQIAQFMADDRHSSLACLDELLEVTIRDFQRIEVMMPIFYDFLALALRRPDVQTIFSDYFKNYLEIITPIMQQGIDSGEFRQVMAREAALALAALIEGTIILKVYDPVSIDLEGQMRAGYRIFRAGLVNQSN